MSLFASFLVLLLILVEAAPPSAASVPQLGVYYACNMVLIMTSVFLSASVVNVSRGGETKLPVPRLLRFIFLDFLSRPLLLRGLVQRILSPYPRRASKHKDEEASCQLTSVNDGYQCVSGRNNATEFTYVKDTALNADGANSTGDRESSENGKVYRCLVTIEERLHRLETNIMRSSGMRNELSEYARRSQEWRLVSIVMDRLYFLLYIVALILSAVIFFPKPGVV